MLAIMPLYWRKNRARGDKPRGHGRLSTVDGNGPSRPSNDDVTGCLDDEDWDEIVDLLSCQKPGDSRLCLDGSGNRVTSSVAELRASIGQQIVPSGPVLDRLLDVWPSCTRLTLRQQDPWSRCSLLW